MPAYREDFAEALRVDLYDYLFDQYEKEPTIYNEIFQIHQSTKNREEVGRMTGMGRLQEKPEGTAVKYREPLEGLTATFTHKTYADGVVFSKELIDDAVWLRNMVFEVASTWAEGVRQTEEAIAAEAFNKGGFTASDHAIYDGKPFLAFAGNEHANMVGETFSNADALNLTLSNLQTVLLRMQSANAYDERGNRIMIRPDTLLVPRELEAEARVILNSEYEPGTPNNDINVLYKALDLVVWPYLTDTDAWFVGTRNKGMIWFDREGAVIDVWQDRDTRGWKSTVTRRFSCGVVDWRYWYGCNISTS